MPFNFNKLFENTVIYTESKLSLSYRVWKISILRLYLEKCRSEEKKTLGSLEITPGKQYNRIVHEK